jgi:hypothetical protein
MNKDEWSITGPHPYIDGPLQLEFILWRSRDVVSIEIQDRITKQELDWLLEMKYYERTFRGTGNAVGYTLTDAGWEYIKLRYLL